MEKISETIGQVMRRLETTRKRLDKTEPDAILKNIFSKKELKHVRFNDLKKGILKLHVDSSAWLYHFSLEKPEILKKCRAGKMKVKEIRFYLGEMR